MEEEALKSGDPSESGHLQLVSAYGPSAGSARVRLHDWMEHLSIPYVAHGYRRASHNSLGALVRSPLGTVAAEWATRRLPARLAGQNVILSRTATPFTRGVLEESILRRAGHGVYDVDDAIMLPQSGLAASLFPKGGVFARAASAADTVVVGNMFLAEHAAAHSKDVRVIPSCVEPDDYQPPTQPVTGRTPRLVWIGSPSTERYLTGIAPAIVEACRRAATELIVISAGDAMIDGLPSDVVRRLPWAADSFATDLALGDVGIMPLADTAWERGKCAYKLLQYGAAGLAMVGSPVGVNTELLAAMGAAAPRTVDEWTDALLVALTGSAQERFEAGQAARRTVVNSYSFAANAPAWRAAVGIPS